MAQNFPFSDGCLGRPGQSTPVAGLGWEHRRAASLPEVSFAPSLPVIRRLAPRRFSATSCRCTWARACVAGLGHWVQGQGLGWGGLFAGGRPPGVAGAGGAPRPLLGGDLRRPAQAWGVTLGRPEQSGVGGRQAPGGSGADPPSRLPEVGAAPRHALPPHAQGQTARRSPRSPAARRRPL